MSAIVRRWVLAAAVGAAVPLAGEPGAVAGRVGDDPPDAASAQASLAAALRDTDPSVRRAVARARASIRTAAALDALGRVEAGDDAQRR